MEYYKETDVSGFYVGSNGTIINQTGIKFVRYNGNGELYVGFELEKNKRIMKKLSHLVYKFHVNRGREIDKDMVVYKIDGNNSNYSASNLALRLSKNAGGVDINYQINKGRNREIIIGPNLSPKWMLAFPCEITGRDSFTRSNRNTKA